MSTTERQPAAPAPSRLPIDPRIRARRVQVKRDEGRRRLRFVAATASVAVIAGMAALATRSPLLDVDHLTVTGSNHTPRLAVLAAAHLHRGTAMTDVHSGASAQGIERLPWVRSAHLVKRWPATVAVFVTERTPVALARTAESWALVDRTGRVLESGRGFGVQGVLPVVVGDGPLGRPGSSLPGSWGSALRVAAAASSNLTGVVASVDVVDGDQIELHLVPTGLVRFGPPDEIDAKLSSLATLLAQVKLHKDMVIDLRVPDAPAVSAGP